MTTFRYERQRDGSPAMFGRLNHVGVATPSIARAGEHYAALFGKAAVGAPSTCPNRA